MKYLAIDTTSAALRVILGADGEIYEFCEEGKKASEILLTAIDGLLDRPVSRLRTWTFTPRLRDRGRLPV